MAIKVKHEGNVTSRVVAANMGGQAESSQKQALSLAQKSAGENSAANRQLSGANAPGAHLMSAHAQLGSAHAGTMSAPKFTPLEERMLVTNEKVNDNQVYDPDRKQWVGKYESGQKRDLIGAIDAKHLASVERAKGSNAVETDAKNNFIALAMTPKAEPASDQPVQYDYTGGQQFQDPYAELAQKFGVSTDDMNRLKGSLQNKVTSPYQTISGMTEDHVRQRLKGIVSSALADKRRGLASVNGQGSSALATALGTQPTAPVQTPAAVADPFGAYDMTLGNGFSVGGGANNAGIWGDKTGRIVTDGNFGF